MMAIQIFMDGRQRALVRGYDAALAHLADAILGAAAGPSLPEALHGLREGHARLAEAGVPCGLLHLLRLRAEAGPARAIEMVWHDLEAQPGRSGVALRHRFAEGEDPAYDLFGALASVADGADPGAVAAALDRRAAAYRRGGDGRGRVDRLRKLQQLVAPGPGNPLALVPPEAEIGGDHAGALAALPDRMAARFEALAAGLRGGAARAP